MSGPFGSGVRVNARTPSATRIGGRCTPGATKYWLSGAPALNVARPTTWRNESFGATGAPPTCTTSQSCGRHGCGRRPLRRTSQRETLSTAPRLTNAPPHVASRNTSTPNAGWSSTGCSAARARRSSCGYVRFDCPGTPLHTAWIARSDGCCCASARWTARSCTATAPTAVSASTPAAIAMPIATTTERPACARRRTSANRSGTSIRRRPAAVVAERLVTGKTLTLVAARAETPSAGLGILFTVLTTNQKGAVAEAEIAAEAIRLGIGVWRPVSDHERYDLILDVGGRLVRTQC